MVDGYGRVRAAFAHLESTKAQGSFAMSKGVGPAGRVDEVLLAADSLGALHVLTELPPGRGQFTVPLGRTLPAEWVTVGEDGRRRQMLDVQCGTARLRPTFLSLIGEMLDRAETTGRPCIDEVNEVLSSWRAAIAREAKSVGRAGVIGLFGELDVLSRLASRDPMRAVNLWAGPQGERHDFSNVNALEVKTFTSLDSPSVTIHGIGQLDAPPGGDLHLLATRIEESDEGRSLADLVEEIARLGVPYGVLLERVDPDLLDSENGQRRFVVPERRLFRVDDDFPGIRRSNVSERAVHGVLRLNYQLQLDSCSGEIDPLQLDRVLEEL